MTHHFFPSPKVLERLYAGPLSDHIDRFVRQLLDQGYATKTVQEKIRLVADLSRWLERKQLKVKDLDEQRINEYLKSPCVRIVVTSDRPDRRWGSSPGNFPIGGGQIFLRKIHFGGGGG